MACVGFDKGVLLNAREKTALVASAHCAKFVWRPARHADRYQPIFSDAVDELP